MMMMMMTVKIMVMTMMMKNIYQSPFSKAKPYKGALQ